MSTSKKKQSNWSKFQETRTWEIFFRAFDSIFRLSTWFVHRQFLALYCAHSGRLIKLYGFSVLLLIAILVAADLIMKSFIPSISWGHLAIIDIVLGALLIISSVYPFWSENYRKKMGYPEFW